MSQQDTQTKTIGAHTFEVGKLDPLDAQDILVEFGQALGPALGKTLTGVAKATKGNDVDSLLDVDIEDPRVGSAIGSIFAGLDKARLRALVLKMVSITWLVGDEGRKEPLQAVYRAVFRGDLALMYQWLWFALEVNFGNFFGWAGNAISGITGIVKAAQSRSTSAATGQS